MLNLLDGRKEGMRGKDRLRRDIADVDSRVFDDVTIGGAKTNMGPTALRARQNIPSF